MHPLLTHPLKGSLSLGKGEDTEAVGCHAAEPTSFTDLFPAMIHDLVDMRGGQPGLVQPKSGTDVFHHL